MKKLSFLLLALLLLLSACAEEQGEAGGRLTIQVPREALAGETVAIEVTDEDGRPVSGVRLYGENELTGTGYIGETDIGGKIVTFFEHSVTYKLTAIKGKEGEPDFAQVKETVQILPGAVELVAFGGIQIGPPPLPGQPPREDSFRPGMAIRFRIRNTATKEITLPNSAPWRIESSEGKVVFAPVALQVIVPLAPGESKEWTWDQKDDNGNQVKEDRYVIVLRCSEGEYRCWIYVVPEGLT